MTLPLRRLALPAACLAGGALMLPAGPALADRIPDAPLARFEAPICPGVIGLQLAAAEQMVGRIRANAEDFGLRLAEPESCEPNVIIAFLADGQDYLQRLAEERPYLFETMSPAEKQELLGETGPVRAWTRTTVRTRDGMFVGERDNLVEVPQASMWSAHSRIYRPTRRDINSVMVVFDRDEIDGYSITQLADYATMRSLAKTYPEEAGSEEASILTLFDEQETAPAELTQFDTAFLAELYEGIPNLPASTRLSGLPEGGDERDE